MAATRLKVKPAYVDPIGAVAPHRITLGSNEAITIMRVSGAVFLGIAVFLVVCIASERRLIAGIGALGMSRSQ
jgi:hypothetical protein